MEKEKTGFRHFFSQAAAEPEFWESSRQMGKIIHRIPDSFQALVLELEDNPMDKNDILLFFDNLKNRNFDRRHKNPDKKTEQNLEKCISLNIIEEKNDKFVLTDGGKEIAGHFKKVIPLFFRLVFSAKTVSKITIAVHAVLSIIKLIFGFLSFSGGLISDGIDNCIDTAASAGIWLGIKYKKERLIALLIIIMMFISVAGIFYMGIEKTLNPEPVNEGLSVLIVSFVCGLVMLGLSAYQYLAGKKTSCFAFMCQAVDSRNHFITSLLVCTGIGLSFAADSSGIHALYYGDAAAAIIIGGIILKSTIELVIEYAKGGNTDTAEIKHFIGTSIASSQRKLIMNWFARNIKENNYSKKELLKKFKSTFVQKTPKLLKLIELDFYNIPDNDFMRHLDALIKAGKISCRKN